jgi:crossover junction endodeoxyribonuclease RuvC
MPLIKLKPLTTLKPLSVAMQSSAPMNMVMGIDVSTDTGIVVLGWDANHNAWRTVSDFEINLPSLSKTATMNDRINRVQTLHSRIFQELIIHCPSIVAIEGYGYANAHSLVTLVEFGTAVRMAMNSKIPVVKTLEVAPASLKKFILGKGVGKKEQVMLQVFKRYGYEAKTNNLADAYVLAQIAAGVMGKGAYPNKGMTKQQLEVLSVVTAKNA